MNSTFRRARRAPTLGAMALLAAACGGGDLHETTAAQAERETVASAALLDDDGAVMPPVPAALPADAAMRTRAGRYATETQARDLRRALGAAVSEVVAAPAGDEATTQTLPGRPAPAAILVRGGDMALAVALADRLDALGLAPVWLVTP